MNSEFPEEDETPTKRSHDASAGGSKEISFRRKVIGSLAFLALPTVLFALSDHDPWWPIIVVWLLFGLLMIVEYRAHIGKGGRFVGLLTRRLW